MICAQKRINEKHMSVRFLELPFNVNSVSVKAALVDSFRLVTSTFIFQDCLTDPGAIGISQESINLCVKSSVPNNNGDNKSYV